MGIAKWRISHSSQTQDQLNTTKSSPKLIEPENEMEMVYAHVRYQKSFDMQENEYKRQQFNQMKESRQQLLKPLRSMGIKKFSKQYESVRKGMYEQIHEERIKQEKKEKYIPPSFTKIGTDLFVEEAKLKELEEIKKSERMNSHKKRDKYWILVKDLYAPKISEAKKSEMQKLKERIDNKRIKVKENKRSIYNSSNNGYQSQEMRKVKWSSSPEIVYKEKPKKPRKRNKIDKSSPNGSKPYRYQENKMQTKEKSESFDYLLHLRNIREQEGDQTQSKAGKLINNIKKVNESNSLVLVNMARIREKEAKRKEQLCGISSSLSTENVKQINQMYMDSIKAKLKFLESMQS